jgi:rare lipoprotein A
MLLIRWFPPAAVLLALAFTGCAHKKRVRLPDVPGPGYTETGRASWYGHPYHGRRAANGEVYDMEKLTAAHRTLPFETWVRVENLTNDKTVEVRITDRGPFVDGRIIDLSHAAARQIEMIGPGVAPVRLRVIRAPENAPKALFAVQVGAFRQRTGAESVRGEMESRYGHARVVPRSGNPELWRVLVGEESTPQDAAALAERIRRESNEKISGFVVRIDV